MKPSSSNPPGITPAATVILTREHAGQLQVYLLKRSLKSGFMPGYFVFPGGTIDREDKNLDIFSSHCDLAPAEIFARFGPDLSKEEALAYCAAAVRETLEEAGVFLAHRPAATAAGLEQACNLRLTAGIEKDWFLKLIVKEKWCLTLSALTRWSHWITPELMKRRFDTRFFLVDMPTGQFCRPDDRETVQGLWLSPWEGLTGNLAGQVPLSPPTLVTLQEILKYRRLKDLQKDTRHRQWGPTLMPRLVPLSEGAVILEPWDPMYQDEEINIDLDDLPASVLPAGISFSRIWLDRGIWKPIGAKPLT
jgi:8-oxo-dGTP pyrophosphatase MutT (NUDIX family)